MKYKAVIFDLDGTLVDSLYDISDAMSIVLKRNNFPTHSYEDYQNFIGSGIRSLVVRSLPKTHQSEAEIEHIFNAMIEVYSDNCTLKTKPYDGIIELLDNLVKQNIKLSVLSNKADELTKKIVAAIFPTYFNPVLGLTVEELKKPHPFGALEVCKSLELEAEEIIYIGDTDVDMQTANNANMLAVGVLWGYRSKEELIASGANYILNKPIDLMKIIQ